MPYATTIGLVVIFILAIATSSIGVECYNENVTFAESKKGNKKFLSLVVAAPVIGLVALAGYSYMSGGPP